MFRGRSSRGGSARGSNFRGRSGARGGSRAGGASRTGGPRGLFADGIWQCNCAPRLPAEHFKVKKEGKNQGRWFYTCQNSEPNRCDFFLWDEDAKLREEGAVLANSRSELANRRATGAQDGWDAGRSSRPGEGIFANVDPATGQTRDGTVAQADDESTDDEIPPPPYSSQKAAGGTKRSANAAGLDDGDDEFFPWPLTGQEEEEMANVADAVADSMPETPRKAARTGVYATPAATTEKKKRQLPWEQQPGLAAPATPKTTAQARTSYFDTPSKPPSNLLPPIPELTGPATPILQPPTPAPGLKSPSPPPSKHRNALVNPADSTSSLTHEALATLSSVAVPAEALSNLRSVLTKHDLRTQGVIKGRDISRLGLKAKDAKITELHARIASLEAEREVDRGIIRNLKLERHGRQAGDDEDGDGEL